MKEGHRGLELMASFWSSCRCMRARACLKDRSIKQHAGKLEVP